MRSLLFLPLLGVCLSCDPFANFANVGESLFDPKSARLDLPGTLLMEGKYTNVVHYSTMEGNVVCALTDEAEPHLHFRRLPEGERCDAGPASSFAFVSSPAGAQILAISPAEEGEAKTLRSYDRNCRVKATVETAHEFTHSSIIIDTDGKLLLLGGNLDGSAAVVMENVVDYVTGYPQIYILTADGTVYAAENVQEPYSIGEGAKSISYNAPTATLFFQEENAVSVSGGTIYHTVDAACAPLYHGYSRSFTVEEPCGSGVRRLYYPFSVLGYLDSVPLPDGVADLQLLDLDWVDDTVKLLLLAPDDTSASTSYFQYPGTLYSAVLDLDVEQDKAFLTESAHNEDIVLVPVRQHVRCEYGYCLGPLEEGGELTYHSTDTYGDLPPHKASIESDVFAFSATSLLCDGVLLARGQQESADLSCLSASGQTTALAEHLWLPESASNRLSSSLSIHLVSDIDFQGKLAIVTDVADGAGNLRQIRITPDALPAGPILAENVLPGTAFTFLDLDGFVYRPGSSPASLRVVVPESDIDAQVAPDVSEYQVVISPTEGLLYTVTSGPEPGIRFAKTK